jgi:hypothetical protein
LQRSAGVGVGERVLHDRADLGGAGVGQPGAVVGLVPLEAFDLGGELVVAADELVEAGIGVVGSGHGEKWGREGGDRERRTGSCGEDHGNLREVVHERIPLRLGPSGRTGALTVRPRFLDVAHVNGLCGLSAT